MRKEKKRGNRLYIQLIFAKANQKDAFHNKARPYY